VWRIRIPDSGEASCRYRTNTIHGAERASQVPTALERLNAADAASRLLCLETNEGHSVLAPSKLISAEKQSPRSAMTRHFCGVLSQKENPFPARSKSQRCTREVAFRPTIPLATCALCAAIRSRIRTRNRRLGYLLLFHRGYQHQAGSSQLARPPLNFSHGTSCGRHCRATSRSLSGG